MELLMAEFPMLALIFVRNLRPETGLRQKLFRLDITCQAAMRPCQSVDVESMSLVGGILVWDDCMLHTTGTHPNARITVV